MAKKDAANSTNNKQKPDDNAKPKGNDDGKAAKTAKGKKGKGEKTEPKKPRTPKELAIAFVQWLWPVIVIVVVVFALRSSLVDWNDVPSGSMQPTIVIGDRIFVNKLSYDLKVPFTFWRIATWDDPKRGDVVIWLHPKEGNWMGKTRLVKRVVGLPGDVIELRDYSNDPATPGMSRLVINGQELTYTPAEAPASTKDIFDSRIPYRYYTEKLGDVEHLVAFVPLARSAQPAVDENGNLLHDEFGNRLYQGVIRSFGPFTVPEGAYFLMGDNRDQSKDSRYLDSIGYAIPRENILGRSSRVVFSLDENWIPRGRRFFHAMP